MAWGNNGTPDTLTTAGNNMNVSDLGGSKFNVVLSHTKRASGNTYSTWYFNNENSSSSYSSRQSENGGSDGTRINANTVFYDMGGDDADKFSITYIFGISSAEKLAIGFGINAGPSAGESGVPESGEFVWKWADTSNTVDRIDNQSGEGTYDTDSNLTVLGSDLTPASAIPFPINVELGSRAEITDSRKIYYRMDGDYESTKWYELGTLPYAGGRGVFAGGYNGSYLDTLDYVTIATLGNATDFGDLSFGRFSFGSCSNKTRGLFMGGAKSGGNSDSIDYITIATLSDSTDFGDIAQDGTKTSGTTAISNNTRGFVAGGESGYTNRIAYVTIDTLGNTTDFGNLTQARKNLGSTNNDTRAVFIGGEGSQSTMDYITMANTPLSNATTFGTLTSGSYQMANGLISNGTRGVFGIGGGTSSGGYNNIIEYITIATAGSSTDFGNLTEGRAGQGQSSSETRGLLAGGKYTSGGGSVRATIDYITIDTTANAGDFGDLTQARSSLSGLSDTGALRE